MREAAPLTSTSDSRSDAETVESGASSAVSARAATPGLVAVFSAGKPVFGVLALERGPDGVLALDLGRGLLGALALDDVAVSRRHARVELEDGRWRVRDAGSRNGTGVNGLRLGAEPFSGEPRVVRTGETLFVPVPDVGPLAGGGVEVLAGIVQGPQLRRVLEKARAAGAAGETLFINGESGSGKELLAAAFHRAGTARGGPLVAVNCAGIPEGIAERLLFGSRRGAFSDAADADGYLRSAHGGTLFLDEVAELGLPVQAKLLRTLETREVVPLGATAGVRIDVRLCSATHKDLRAEVAAGRFRQDLYFRLGTPAVLSPPLRARPEELVWVVANEVERVAPGLPIHVSFIEECLVRPWPGNVRELLVEVRRAALRERGDGPPVLAAEQLGATAGLPVGSTATRERRDGRGA